MSPMAYSIDNVLFPKLLVPPVALNGIEATVALSKDTLLQND